MFGGSSGGLPSVMKHNFSKVPAAEIQRSSFDRSHGIKLTCDAGLIIPFLLDEVLPGDTFNVRATLFARMNTPIVPPMDNLYCDTHFFFVPNRLVWENFQKFCGEQEDPGDSTSYFVPQMVAPAVTGYATHSLQDFFGLPIKIPSITHSAIPFRGYNLIWREWFRDENLQDSPVVDKSDAASVYTDYVVLPRGRRHDYFTSCLPFAQKGTAVSIPLGTSAPVLGIGTQDNTYAAGGSRYSSDGSMHTFATEKVINAALGGAGVVTIEQAGTTGFPNIRADLNAATAATINNLRQAFQIQRLLERDARGGTRFTEIIRSHFGVVSDDARLQRPEFLGGGTTQINFSVVPQTSGTPVSGTPQGNLSAFGTFSGTHGFVKSFTEHGFVFGFLSIRADQNYQQGMNRMWSRSTRYDFYWPALSHLGEQAVLNKEIYTQGPAVTDPATGVAYDEEVFGYQERYAEYRYKPSQITGQFRSTATTPLDIWHLADKYVSLPVLDDTFISLPPPVDRVVATPAEPHFKVDGFIKMICARPMPMYSVPGLIDHF